MYLFQSISSDVQLAQLEFRKHLKTKRLIIGSFLACMAAIFQVAGGILPGIGYFISPFATLPILICTMFSFSVGFMSYFLTNLLLFILQPSELMVFPFTTGLLGIGIGAGFSFLKKRVSIISVGAILLTLGMISLLYVFDFPVLGPIGSNSFSILTTGSILFFSFLYSCVWVEISFIVFKRLKSIFIK